MSERLVLDLHVQPGAKKTEFAGMHGERRKVRLAAPPVDGKANDALIAFIAAQYGVPKRNVTIDAGEHSRQKRVTVWKKKS
jgi:uncharacterized protein (TIGR00251 family)